MTAVTATFQLTVAAPQQSVPGLIAEAMSGPQWSSELETPYFIADNYPTRPADSKRINDTIAPDGTNASGPLRAFLAYSSATGATYGTLNGWTGKAYEDAAASGNPRVWYISGTTGANPWSQTATRYDSATDQFLKWQGSAPGSSDGLFHPQGGPHNFGSVCFDSTTRRLYRITGGTGSPEFGRVGWFSVDTQDSGLFANVYGFGGVFPACDFMPEIGTQGSIIAAQHGSSDYNQLRRYDIAAQNWFSDIPGTRYSPSSACIAYNSGNVYFSHGDGNMYRVEANATVTSVAGGTPIAMHGGGTGEVGHTVWSSMGDYIYAFCESGPIYRFDVLTQTWSGVLDQMVSRPSAGRYEFTAAPLTQFGVFLFIYYNGTGETALLWKP